ncbi:hypothetical protein AgCh_021723 [Apium graveolens]
MWRYTGYYGFPERGRRTEAWDMLRQLERDSLLPWCIIGDFNDLMTADEKEGGHIHPRALLNGFSEAINDCALIDLGYKGDKFTWERFRGTDKWVVERLDRGFANKEWTELFSNAEVRVHEVSTSDHMPLCLQLNRKVYMPKGRRFRFENMWVQEKECRNIVHECWHNGGEHDLLSKLARCCQRLEEWGGGLIKNLKSKLAFYRKEMQRLKSRRDRGGVSLYNEARWNYLRLLEKQEVFWSQRAKQYWLRNGDNNTRFFHKFATTRQKHNRIQRIKDANGDWQDTEEGIQNTITRYFENIFLESDEGEQMSDSIRFNQITDEQRDELMQELTEEEVKEAVFAMQPEKSPGIDGLNPCFFQTYWNVVCKDVFEFCRQFFEHGSLPDEVNRTLVCLIPKVKCPKQVADLRPISLCNVVMRILSKVLANRLKPCLGSIISNNQSAFIEGRLLTDNALLAFEINHYIHRKTQGNDGVAALKIDISKAYDRLEWRYIELMMNRMGFPQNWIVRVMQLVKKVSYSFLRNGKVFGDVRPSRGIRQGDPISPYLYIICAEGLTGILNRYEENRLIHGCRVARGAPSITHLLFADDCYLFFKAKQTEAQNMWSILQKYEKISGQMINFGKSDIVFSPNTCDMERTRICVILGVNEKERPGKYLGMPMYVGRSKKEVFGFISDKIQSKLQAWSNKDLSKAGKLTLVKTAAQVTPNFWMSLFLIPDSICDESERKMNAFLWGNGAAGRGIKWITWKRLCMPKEFGGLGLKELKKFNMAMLAKQGWRLLTEANPLISAVLKARYYPKTGLLDAELGNNPSYVWRGIFASLKLVKTGARRRVGNGENTLVWHDPWLPDVVNGYVRTTMYDQLSNAKVSNLMTDDGRNWDVEVIADLLETRDCELIMRIPLSMNISADSWYWLLEDKGDFTVKSCYRAMQGECTNDYTRMWKKIWALKLPSKVTHLIWRFCKDCLPTNAALFMRYVNVEATCPWCHRAAETSIHQGSREQCVEVAMLCWSLWYRRNRWIWDRANGTVFGVKNTASCLLQEWTEAQAREESRRIRGETGDRVWSLPLNGWLKINVDAAVFMNGSIGVAAVIRDDRGGFVAARALRIPGAWKPREAEAIAMKEALSWVTTRGYKQCVFETDSYVLADACNGSTGRSLFDTIVTDCIELIKHISPVLFSFAYRSANNVAHVLAQTTCSMSDVGEWYVTPPNFLIHALDLDLII